MFGLDMVLESFNLLNEKDTDTNIDDAGTATSPDDTDTGTDNVSDDEDKGSDDTTDDNPDSKSEDTPPDDDTSSEDDSGDGMDDFNMDGGGDSGDSTDDSSDPSATDPSADGADASMTDDTSTDPQEKTKKQMLIQNYITLYDDISFAIKSFKKMGIESDEEKDLIEKGVENLLNIRQYLYIYVTTSFDSDDYSTCLYKLYYFKDVMRVADEILQKIKELRQES